MRPQPRETKQLISRHRILNEIFRVGTRSRLELARELNINPTTAGEYAEDLIARGLLLEGEPATAKRGRSPIPLHLNPDYGCFLGLDFEALRARAVLCDFAGNELRRKEVSFPPRAGREEILRKITRLARTLEKNSGRPLLSIGIAAPGLVDAKAGRIVKYSILPDFDEVPLANRFEEAFEGLPVFVEHNIRCLTQSELLRGSGQNCRHFLCLAARSGIAVGIVINGKHYEGATSMTGQVGHTFSPESPDGSRRSANELVSATGVIQDVSRSLHSLRRTEIRTKLLEKGDELALSDIVKAAEAGDEFIRQRLEDLGSHLGIIAANLANIFSPEKIVLAGDVPSCAPFVRDQTERAFRDHALPHILQTAYLENSSLGDFAGAFGAAWMGIPRLFPEDEETVLQWLAENRRPVDLAVTPG